MAFGTFDKRFLMRGGGAALSSISMPYLARGATRHLRIGHNNLTQSVTHAGAAAFANAVAVLSEGRLQFDIFPNATIGDEWQMMKAVAAGALDASVNMIGTTTDYAKEVSLVEMPYLFPNVASARRSFDGALGRHCADLLGARGITIVAWGEYGLRHVTANKAVRTPADLIGVKLRVQVSEPTLQTFLAMGAAAEMLPFTQLPEALRTGRFEAQENPFAIIIPSRLDARQSHLSMTGHIYTPSLFALSSDVMDELSSADRVVIGKAGAAGAAAMRDFSDHMDDIGPGLLRTAGKTVLEDVDRSLFRKAAEGAIDKLRGIFGASAVEAIRSYA